LTAKIERLPGERQLCLDVEMTGEYHPVDAGNAFLQVLLLQTNDKTLLQVKQSFAHCFNHITPGRSPAFRVT
jgi:hypothetical protein